MVSPFPAAFTRERALALAEQLEAAAAALFEAPEKQDELLRHMLPQRILASLPAQSLDARAATLRTLAQGLLDRPILGLTVAFEPSAHWLLQTLAWLSQQGPGECVVEVTVDSDIVGGAIIEWRGHRANYSLAEAINQHPYEPV